MIFIATLFMILALETAVSASDNASVADIQEQNITLDSWHPQVIEYLYVNDTVNRTVRYSITTSEQLNSSFWTVDGEPVESGGDGSTYYHEHIWDNLNRGLHIVNFKGNSQKSLIGFQWYVNVHEIGGRVDGSIFDIIDDSIESHAIEINIYMFRFGILDENGRYGFVSQKARKIHDEIETRQMKRQALGLDFKSGNITFEEYVAAIKQVQKETRFYMRLSKEFANIIRSELNNEELAKEFENFSLTEEDWEWHERV